MAKLDNLISRIADSQLRLELEGAVSDLRKVTDFGLVFESHLPETVRLPHLSIRRGVKVALREDRNSPLFSVVKLEGSKVTIHEVLGSDADDDPDRRENDSPDQVVDVANLIAVAEFGDPVYPGLSHLGSINLGGKKPAHVVINGENHHALEALKFTHAGKVDCIYIDPPYNTRDRDWKYNNNYVDSDDDYRHSKWLAFMERRLKLAKQLLNPVDSVMIVTIDEKEYAHLGLLLEQVFPRCKIQMVSTVINPQGTSRTNEFSRTNEYIFFVMIGSSTINSGLDNMFDRDGSESGGEVEWRNLRRREKSSKRGSRPNQFYAVFVDPEDDRIHSVGDPLDDDVPLISIKAPAGTRAVFPLKPNGEEMIWGVVPASLRDLVAALCVNLQ